MSDSAVLSITVDPAQYKDDVFTLMKLVKPSWETCSILFKVFSEGITNQLFGCYLKGQRGDMVLVRVYGKNTEFLIDRDREYASMSLLHSLEMGPKVYCRFTNGMCYGYQEGRPITVAEVQKPNISNLITREMVRLHGIKSQQVTGNVGAMFFQGEPVLFKKLKAMLQLVPDHYLDSRQQERYMSGVVSQLNLCEEYYSVCRVFDECDATVAICHNDLLLNNIIYNETTDSISFIDFEYMNENYIAYDIANHFCEYAGVDQVDFSRCPNKDYQLKWIKNYLELSKKLSVADTESADTPTVSNREINHLYVWVNKFFVVSHLFWGVWALIQAHNSAIHFDFLGYAILRLNEYLRCKHLLQLQPDPTDPTDASDSNRDWSV
ncbi:probable ethanolamine kinase [Argonauta hians]